MLKHFRLVRLLTLELSTCMGRLFYAGTSLPRCVLTRCLCTLGVSLSWLLSTHEIEVCPYSWRISTLASLYPMVRDYLKARFCSPVFLPYSFLLVPGNFSSLTCLYIPYRSMLGLVSAQPSTYPRAFYLH